MGIKLNKKDKVIFNGAGSRRVVFCFDSGLVYSYQSPEKVLAVFDGKSWVVAEKPYYSRGGWGNSSRGDSEGEALFYNTTEILKAINASILQVNLPSLMSMTDYSALVKAQKAQEKIKKALGEEYSELVASSLEGIKALKIKSYESGKGKGKGLDVFKKIEQYSKAIKVFIEGKGRPCKVDEYSISPNLVKQGETIVSFRTTDGKVYLNSQVLQLNEFEKRILGHESVVQAEVRKIASVSIPLNVLDSAGLQLGETKILEQGPEETLEIRKDTYSTKTETRHFTGALLLENSGRKFLMDIDREEIKHRIFNAFFVEVKNHVSTIAEAYDSMIPEKVKEAKAKGIKVERQGEFFFLDTGREVKFTSDLIKYAQRDDTDKKEDRDFPHLERGMISMGKGRPNTCLILKNHSDFSQGTFVAGTVEHTGREHRPLKLGVKYINSEGKEETQDSNYFHKEDGEYSFKVWEVIPNETQGNFTIQGDVD